MQNITSDMTLNDVLELDPSAARILMAYGMHCLGCPHSRAETLEEAADVHGIELQEMLDKLNDNLKAKAI